jgi:hypothetical protein
MTARGKEENIQRSTFNVQLLVVPMLVEITGVRAEYGFGKN